MRAKNKRFIIRADQTDISCEVSGWDPLGVSVSNPTNQYLFFPTINDWIAPLSRGTFALGGEPVLPVMWGAPPGITQPIGVTTPVPQQASIVLTDQPLPNAGGPISFNVSSVTTTGSMILIQDQVLAVAAGTIDFLAIATTFKHLMLIASLRHTVAAVSGSVAVRLNADAGANYDCHAWEIVSGVLSTFAATDFGGGTFWTLGGAPGATAPANKSSALSLWLPNYVSSAQQKSGRAENAYGTSDAAGGMRTNGMSGTWLSLASITQVSLISASTFAIGSRASLYGLL